MYDLCHQLLHNYYSIVIIKFHSKLCFRLVQTSGHVVYDVKRQIFGGRESGDIQYCTKCNVRHYYRTPDPSVITVYKFSCVIRMLRACGVL